MPVEPSRPRSLVPGVLLGAYLAALVYGTLYPMRGWRMVGQPALGFLLDPWPRYWSWLDLLLNVAIYLPAGVLGVLSISRGRRARWLFPLVVVTLCASGLSLALEALQSFMPGRVPSRTDWLANSCGALIGAFAVRVWPSAGRRTPDAWRTRRSTGVTDGIGLGLLAAWIAAQMHPERPLFGHGDLLAPMLWLAGWRSDTGQAASPAPGFDALAASLRASAEHAVPLEAFACASAIVGVGLLVREIWPARAQRIAITAMAIGVALLARSLGSAVAAGSAQALAWLSSGAQGGLVIGTVALSMLSAGTRKTRLRAAIVAVALGVMITSAFPDDNYGSAMRMSWEGNVWRNFDGLLAAAATLWPLAAIAWCLARLRMLRRDEPETMEWMR